MATVSQSKPQIPRPSASLIIVNARNEVLLVHRNPQARHFGGVHVFPGGNFDRAQDESLALTAIRETFEESGLLLASAPSPGTLSLSGSTLEQVRHDIHSQRLNFKTFLAAHSLVPDTESLLPFTQWITPANLLRRFQTQFFVVFLPTAPSSGFSSGSKREHIPKPDGGQEVVSASFLHPEEAIAEFRERKITFMPPQMYLLSTLADILRGRTNTAEQRESVERLSKGNFGRMVMNPGRLLPEHNDGWTVFTYEGDQTRGGPKGRLHRVMVKFGKDRMTSEIVLQRNFDIFNEIEADTFNGTSSKL